MTAKTFAGVERAVSGFSVVVRFVAGEARQILAVSKTAAREKTDRSEPDGNGIFQLRFIATICGREAMALTTDLN